MPRIYSSNFLVASNPILKPIFRKGGQTGGSAVKYTALPEPTQRLTAVCKTSSGASRHTSGTLTYEPNTHTHFLNCFLKLQKTESVSILTCSPLRLQPSLHRDGCYQATIFYLLLPVIQGTSPATPNHLPLSYPYRWLISHCQWDHDRLFWAQAWSIKTYQGPSCAML